MKKPLIVYTYARCSTCRDAVAWLRQQGIPFEERPIYTQAPSLEELRAMLRHVEGELRKLFNTSGLEYRARGLKDKLPGLSQEEALALLHGDGRLVKRPFVLGEGIGLLGFKQEAWAKKLTTQA